MFESVIDDPKFAAAFPAEVADSAFRFAFSTMLQNAQPCCSVADLDFGFAKRVYDVWRDVPFVINSAYRSKDYELSRHRSGTSSHCKGLAIDVSCIDNVQRFELVNAFLRHGFTRIGVGARFIHVDADMSKPQNRIWTYSDNNKERR